MSECRDQLSYLRRHDLDGFKAECPMVKVRNVLENQHFVQNTTIYSCLMSCLMKKPLSY